MMRESRSFGRSIAPTVIVPERSVRLSRFGAAA